MDQSPLAVQVDQAIKQACLRLLPRLAGLEQQLQAGDETAWPGYLATLTTLAALVPQLAPGFHGELLTTKQMAARLGISTKTLLKKQKGGALGHVTAPLKLGARGRAALRWRA